MVSHSTLWENSNTHILGAELKRVVAKILLWIPFKPSRAAIGASVLAIDRLFICSNK